MPHFNRDFRGDYAAFEEAVRADERFCFVRFHDGEYACLRGSSYKSASGWWIRRGSRGAKLWLQEPLLQSLKANMPGYHVGISPSCCVRRAAYFLRTNVGSPPSRLTFSTLFFNANYESALRFLRELDGFVVSSGKGDYRVPSDGVNREWDVDGLVTKLLEVDKPILLAAGPCSCIIGHRYWERALERQTREPGYRPQMLIDVGSALDVVIHDRRTRQYHDKANSLRLHVCGWGDALPVHGEAAQTTRIVDRSGRLAPRTQPQQHVTEGLSPATMRRRPLDSAVLENIGESPASRKKKVKEFLGKQVSKAQWARQRVRRKR